MIPFNRIKTGSKRAFLLGLVRRFALLIHSGVMFNHVYCEVCDGKTDRDMVNMLAWCKTMAIVWSLPRRWLETFGHAI